MLKNFIKVIFRYLFRTRFFTFLNLAGLSIGMACCIIIYLFIKNELSYDRFHAGAENIYRVLRQSQINGVPYNIGVTSGPYAMALQQDFNGRVQSVTRVASFNSLLVQYADKSFLEDRMVMADKNFFQFFSYPLLTGDAATVLADPNNLVVSKTFAKKYFGDENPVGKILRLNDEHDLIITGVLDDKPGHSHLQFETVGALSLLEREGQLQEWWSNFLNTYVQVDNASDVGYLNQEFPAFMEKYLGADFQRVGNRIGLKLEPLQEIYFNYDTRYEHKIAHGNWLYVFVFGSLGLLLMVLASINYINLATAQSAQRAKEVGIRKTLGSNQRDIAAQFLSESFFLCLMAMIIALLMSQLSIPLLNRTFSTSIPTIGTEPDLLFFLGGMVVVICVLAGGYPAFLISSFKPIRVLKGEVSGNLQYLLVRKALVVFQFGISAIMIMGTLFIGKQLRYLNEKDFGFKPDQVIMIRINNAIVEKNQRSFKDRLMTQKNVLKVSLASTHPGGFYDASTVNIQGEAENLRMRTLWADEDLLPTLDIKIAAGRFFNKESPGDSINSVVLNEAAVLQLGWTADQAIGKKVMLSQFDSVYKEVVGIVRDFHFTSLKETIEPLLISYSTSGSNLLVKVEAKNLEQSVSSVERIWNSYESGFPMEMVFVDEILGRLYANESNQGKLFSLFSVISVFIACLGILGLSSYIAAQRKKEIGVRKVLGASVGQVSLLLTTDLLKLVVVANLLALPVAYWILDQWSQSFAYRAPFDPLIFVIGAVSVTLIALTIIGLNAAKVAHENPVKALRSE